jgi:exopolyphosphatase/guanosine-5'-triphosphate,3'-diphosphate pyrophosphatase
VGEYVSTNEDGQLQAAIGIGSNSVRLLVARRTESDIEAVKRMEMVTRLAGYKLSGGSGPYLDTRAVEESLSAARRFANSALDMRADIRGVIATEAVRAATNSAELTTQVERELGVPVTVITGEEEAALGWRAVAADYFERREPLGVIDIGGGSSDLAVGDAHTAAPQSVLSIPLGAHLAMKRYDLHKPVEYTKTAGILASLGIELYDNASAMRPRPHAAVAIGGTAEVLMSVYATLERGEPDPHTPLDRDWLGGRLMRLAALDHEGRVDMGVPEDKADIAAAGGAILLVLLDAWGLQKFHVSQRSILDGYLLGLAR